MEQEQLRTMILQAHKNRFATNKFDPTQPIDEKD